jgi:HAD superfamily hydrolase (TIGR01509 family)
MPGTPEKGGARLRAVIFDWDGTLLDSFAADAAAYEEMFAHLSIPWGRRELEEHYSPDWYRVYRAAGIPGSRWQEADALWRRAYLRQRPQLMPGVRRALAQLRQQYALALVTSGNRSRVTAQLRRFGFGATLAPRVCSEDAPRRKPHPAPLRVALRRLRLPPEACVYVGDSAEDVEMARRAGVRAIGIFGPFPNHARLRAARPLALLNSITQLPGVLRRL